MSARGDGRALERLAELLREQGGLMASLVDTSPASGAVTKDPGGCTSASQRVSDGIEGGGKSIKSTGSVPVSGPAQLAASGPRAGGQREEYELLVEAIYEGYLLHYGAPRVLAPPEADLGLLAGDRLYALGLARLVVLGDTEAVAELADTITLGALAQAAGQPALAGAVWEAGARAVGWGSSDAHRRAKRLAFAGAPEAIEAMRTSTVEVPAST